MRKPALRKGKKSSRKQVPCGGGGVIECQQGHYPQRRQTDEPYQGLYRGCAEVLGMGCPLDTSSANND